MKSGSIKGRKPLWIAIIAIVAWLGISSVAGPTFGKLSTVQENDNSGFLPDNAESTKTAKVTVKFADSANDQLPTLLLFLGDMDVAKLGAINQYLATLSNKKVPGTEIALSEYILPGSVLAAFPSQDGKAALANIPLNSKVATDNIDDKPALPQIIKFIRSDLATNFDSKGLTTNVTGFGGILADLFGAFGSIDSSLLLTTLAVVSIILIIVYRSPFLWILPLFSAVTALSLAGTIIYYLAKANVIDLNGQSQGILSVLVLGAATDYALLLISRYREELHHHVSRYESMKIALRGVLEPIVASGSTVIAGLLVLLLSDLSSNRGLGPVGAIGIASSMITVLTFLPALLVVFGRWIFWPKVPRFDDVNEQLTGFWSKVGTGVERHPKR
ncbi:MAG: MMPL family transporter, partial [Actinobacteria bacterium]|nr:MMPL family transporter [Actinomycetota bacterium]